MILLIIYTSYIIQDLLICLKQKISQMVNFGNKRDSNTKENTMWKNNVF